MSCVVLTAGKSASYELVEGIRIVVRILSDRDLLLKILWSVEIRVDECRSWRATYNFDDFCWFVIENLLCGYFEYRLVILCSLHKADPQVFHSTACKYWKNVNVRFTGRLAMMNLLFWPEVQRVIDVPSRAVV